MDSFVFVFLGVHEPAGLVDECFLEPWEMFSPFLRMEYFSVPCSLPRSRSAHHVCVVCSAGSPTFSLGPFFEFALTSFFLC